MSGYTLKPQEKNSLVLTPKLVQRSYIIDDPERNSHRYSHLVFENVKKIYWEKGNFYK